MATPTIPMIIYELRSTPERSTVEESSPATAPDTSSLSGVLRVGVLDGPLAVELGEPPTGEFDMGEPLGEGLDEGLEEPLVIVETDPDPLDAGTPLDEGIGVDCCDKLDDEPDEFDDP